MKKVALAGLIVFLSFLSCKTRKKTETVKTETKTETVSETKKSFIDSIFDEIKSHSENMQYDLSIHAKQIEISDECPVDNSLSLTQTAAWVGETKHLKDRDSVNLYDYNNPTTQIKGVDYGNGKSSATLYKDGKKRTVKGFEINVNLKKAAQTQTNSQVSSGLHKSDSLTVLKTALSDKKETKKSDATLTAAHPDIIKGWLIFGGVIIFLIIVLIIIKTKTKKQ